MGPTPHLGNAVDLSLKAKTWLREPQGGKSRSWPSVTLAAALGRVGLKPPLGNTVELVLEVWMQVSRRADLVSCR